jgi:methyl-accepting chemotaxis protein
MIRKKLGNKIMLGGIGLVLCSIAVTAFLAIFEVAIESDRKGKSDLKQRIELMRYLYSRNGPFQMKDGMICAGDYSIADSHETVDRISEIFGGTATVFLKDTRISTSVRNQDGSRAVGTRLAGVAYDSIFRDKKIYSGEASILGIEYYTRYEPITDSSGEIIGILYAGVKKDEYRAAMYGIFSKILITALIIGLVCSLLTFLFGRRIAMAIGKVSLFARELAGGNLKASIDIDRHDELGRMSADLISMRDRLRETVSEISAISLNLSTSSEELAASSDSFSATAQTGAASAEEISSTIEELTAGMENIALSAENQKTLIDQLISRLGDFSSNARATQNKIAETRELAAKINSEAGAGEKRLEEMSRTMNLISRGSMEMQSITSIINDISDQINLLSLNASIEAARAGEAGRGFAVVAEEISKLADATSNSIKSIDGLIKNNDSEIAKGLGQASETVTSISNIVAGINRINDMMESQIEFVRRLDDSRLMVEKDAAQVVTKAEDIKNATREQELAANEIVSVVGSITDLNQTIATGSEEIAASSQTIAKMAENLNARLDFFRGGD